MEEFIEAQLGEDEKEKNYTKIPNDILLCDNIPSAAKLVYCVLKSRQFSNLSVKLSYSYLCKKCNFHHSTIRRAIFTLIKRQIIEFNSGKGSRTKNEYIFKDKQFWILCPDNKRCSDCSKFDTCELLPDNIDSTQTMAQNSIANTMAPNSIDYANPSQEYNTIYKISSKEFLKTSINKGTSVPRRRWGNFISEEEAEKEWFFMKERMIEEFNKYETYRIEVPIVVMNFIMRNKGFVVFKRISEVITANTRGSRKTYRSDLIKACKIQYNKYANAS